MLEGGLLHGNVAVVDAIDEFPTFAERATRSSRSTV